MIEAILADITTLPVDAIVNAANETLAGGGGVDGAIHAAAGPELARASTALAPCEPGDAVITPAYRLAARYVSHTVGPRWTGGARREPDILRRAYESSFARALEQGDVRTIAFPAISTGIFGFPRELAAGIAVEAMRAHETEFDRIVACLFDPESLTIYDHLLA